MSIKPIITKSKQKKFVFNNDFNYSRNDEPIIPMSKVCSDVIKKLQTQPYPQLALATHSTISQALELYYNQYIRLFKQNQLLNDQLASILIERNSLADQFNQIKKMKSYDDNIRRRRRYASQIQRNYHCPMPKCNKGYGSQGSLTHHVRLKHPKFFQSGEYQIYLQTYILPKQQIKNQQDNKDQYIKVSINIQQGNQEKKQQSLVNFYNFPNDESKNVNTIEISEQKLNIDIDRTKQQKQEYKIEKQIIQLSEENSRKIIQQVDGYMNMDENVSENVIQNMNVIQQMRKNNLNGNHIQSQTKNKH